MRGSYCQLILKEMISLYPNPWIKGLTTNPTLMRKAGVGDYESFAKDVFVLPASFDERTSFRF
jgi:transaldolase